MGGTHPATLDGPPRVRWAGLLALSLTLGGLAVALLLGAASDGFYHDDDITHFLFARDAWTQPRSMWHWWSRPGYNIPTMLVAHFFGVLGCRFFSALQTAAVAFLAYLIARRLARYAGVPAYVAALAPALVWVQPLAMTLASTTLTETTAAVYVTLAVWLYLRGNRIWACAALSPAFVTRYETMALAPIVAGAVVYDCLRAAEGDVFKALTTPWAWACALAAMWAPAAQAVASVLANLPPEDSILHMFRRQYSGEYGHGEWTHFLVRWLLAAGGGTLALAAAGAIRVWRRGWLVWALAVGLVLVHTLVYRFGSFASGGYERFLVPVCGLVGALAALGLGAAWHAAGRFGAEGSLFVLAAALFAVPRYASYVTQYASWLWPWLRMERVVPVAALLLLGGCSMAVSKAPRWRSALGRPASVIALGIAAVQAAVMIRPLTTAASPLSIAVARCVHEVGLSPYGGNAALTTHVLVRLLRDDTDLVENRADAEEQWKRAHPGTLFYWDSKYGGDFSQSDSPGPLYAALGRRGRLLAKHWVSDRGAAVFLRLVGTPPASGPAASTRAGRAPPAGLRGWSVFTRR